MEDMKNQLSKEIGLPVYIIADKIFADSDCEYREQHEIDFRKRTQFDLALSCLTNKGVCVERIDHKQSIDENGKVCLPYTIRRFNLSPAEHLRFAVPVLSLKQLSSDMMKCIKFGIDAGITLKISKNDSVPEELKYFICEVSDRLSDQKFSVINFATSTHFMRSDIVESKWHIGGTEPNLKSFKGEEYKDTGFKYINPPGQYTGSSKREYFAPNSAITVCTRKPGPCVVCYGSSDEERHLGFERTNVLICKTCLPKAFHEWLQIINRMS